MKNDSGKRQSLVTGIFMPSRGSPSTWVVNQVTAFHRTVGCGKSTFLKTLNRMNDLGARGCASRAACAWTDRDIFSPRGRT